MRNFFYRSTAAGVLLALLFSSSVPSAWSEPLPASAAAPADPGLEGADLAKKPTANTPANVGAPGNRPPMIEVSVDSLEISEKNSDILGILWGDVGATSQNGGPPTIDNNRLNFLENNVPRSILKIGTLQRQPLQAQFNALIQSNQIRVLANPTLLTKSGSEASFLVGGEIPYPTPGQLGQIGVEFKKYGVSLKILPTLTPRNTIDATITVAVSDVDTSVATTISGVSVPGLSAREANSKVEVNDGETVVLAGIKQSKRTKIVTKVPFLGAIPLIGLLFRNTENDVTQTSLVFFVTFRLVK